MRSSHTSFGETSVALLIFSFFFLFSIYANACVSLCQKPLTVLNGNQYVTFNCAICSDGNVDFVVTRITGQVVFLHVDDLMKNFHTRGQELDGEPSPDLIHSM